MKKIKIQTKEPIEIAESSLVEAVNELRREHGEGDADKVPYDLSTILQKTRLFENRDADNGMLVFHLCYMEDGRPCSRDFPNFGLEIEANNRLDRADGRLFLSVDMTITAGRPKWQQKEIAEAGAVLASGEYKLEIFVCLDETTDFGGYSTKVDAVLEPTDAHGLKRGIPADHFFTEIS